MPLDCRNYIIALKRIAWTAQVDFTSWEKKRELGSNSQTHSGNSDFKKHKDDHKTKNDKFRCRQCLIQYVIFYMY